MSAGARLDVHRPPCMDDDAWGLWAEANDRITASTSRALSPCSDCEGGFAREMRAAGRCDGMPHRHEERDEPMDTLPRSPADLSSQRAKRRVELATPCSTCAHAPICLLREQLAGLSRGVEVAIPELQGALTVTLGMSVACEHYLKTKANGHAAAVTPATTSGPVSCPRCDRTFRAIQPMAVHLRRVHDEARADA